MAEIDNQKPDDASKPKLKPEDSTARALTVFAQSLAYTAVESPAAGGAQLIDHALGTKLEETVQTKLANAGIQQPEAAAYGTKAWTAEQLGNGIGMVVPMWLARKTMVGKAEQALVKGASVEGGFAASVKQASLADNAFREAQLSFKTGFLYGAALTPTDDKSSSGNILVDRLKQGFNSGVTFGAMGYSSSLTSGVLGRAAASLESTALPSVFKSPLQTALHSSLIHGAIGGVPGGAIQAQLGAMESGKKYASLQDFKESVVSMTMVGGAMGSAGLFKETSAKPTAKINFDVHSATTTRFTDNLAVLHHDGMLHATAKLPEAKSDRPSQLPVRSDFERKSAQFNIRFGPIKEALPADEVNKFMTKETRSIEFARKDRENHPDREHWNKFGEWGVEKRDVEVNVYRFPGIKAEIVVPSDYARSLEQVRELRLQFAPGGAGEPTFAEPAHVNRILPEEIAQMLKFLPQSNIVQTVELLDHANPWDLKLTHEARLKATEKGEEPELQPDFVALADASTSGDGRIRYFNSSTHEPHQLQRTTFHEWSHLVQIDPAYGAFASAAKVEKDGFYARKYAEKNDQENWAVHLGERFLSPSGANFATLPEKAPARTLVMAKALRNMLEERKDDPSPKHAEFLARTQAAEDVATNHMLRSIYRDLVHGNYSALQERLEFLNTAASASQSPEILAKVFSTFGDQLEPFLKKANIPARVMHEVQANRWAYKQATDYAPEDMPSFMQRWRGVSSRNALVSLYKALPEPGQQYFREALTNDPTGGVRSFLTGMIENTKGSEQKSFQQTFDTAQENFEKRGLEFSDRNERIPFEFEEWMEKSDKPEVRLAVLKSSSPVTAWAFGNVIEGLPPAALRQMIANGALEYVAPEYKNAAWEHALSKLPEDQKAELLREVRDKQNPAYPNLAAIKFNFDFNAKPRPPLADNLGALRLDSKVHAKKIEPLTGKAQSAPNNITGIVLDSLPLEPAKPAHPFDIKFDRFDTAWAPEKVNQYMTVETRSISFTPEGREGLVGHKEWSDFENWGVDSREVPVNVYRFPGIEAEIVVPSDYAKILDQVRQGRLNSNEPNSHAAPADGIAFVPHDQRILPEEIAQLLIQLPNSDIVKSVELLDHADPWNLKNNHDQLVQARENGEALPERDFVALADADGQGLGRIRFYNSTSNHPAQMQETMSHEWAHLVEQNEAYKAFENAEDLERNGFYARDYARKNASENWAVHLGEEFLARDGEGFADLPEKAPARTLVMAKALRNMLEQRKDNPSPKHDEFLKRVNAAESIATQRLQEGIREDIAKGDENSLADKLHFLNIAASRGKSPEMLHKVLAPLDAELRPVLEARGRGDKLANEVIANRLGALQAENYSPDLMPELSRRWGAMTDSTAQMELFRRLPDEAKESLLEDLSTNAVDSTPSLLNGLIKENSGHTKKLFKDIWEIAQANFEAQGLALYRSGQAIPKPYLRWMETSDIPEARLAALKNRDTRAATHNFNELTREFEPQALRKFIAGDAMSYVDSEFKDVVWKHVLQRLPQEEQVKLFRELGREHDPAYRKIATRINKMDATEFDAEFDNIRKDSLKILLKRESTPEYIMSHPDRIKDARSFIDTTKKMGEQPIIDLIQAGALDSLSIDDIDTIVKSTSQRFDAAALVDILGAIKPDRESLSLINELSTLSENDDPEVATRAQKLLVDIGDAQLMFLKAKSEREDGRNAYECYDALESFLMNADNARARLLYVNADLYNPHGATVADKIRWGALDLSDSQMLEYLRSGIVDLLTPAERNKFLRTVSLDASPEVNAQLKSMGLKPARR